MSGQVGRKWSGSTRGHPAHKGKLLSTPISFASKCGRVQDEKGAWFGGCCTPRWKRSARDMDAGREERCGGGGMSCNESQNASNFLCLNEQHMTHPIFSVSLGVSSEGTNTVLTTRKRCKSVGEMM